MLPATDAELDYIRDYLASEAPDFRVRLLQKVHSESVRGIAQEIWDLHTQKGRWWVITSPTKMYSQKQFPSMDIALTFHIGLTIRVLQSEQPDSEEEERSFEFFAACHQQLSNAHEALSQAREQGDFQSIGVRCREALLAFVDIAQQIFPWKSDSPEPKRGDFKAWTEHVCSTGLKGESHEYRRHLFKMLLDSAWRFDNWLTHSHSSSWHDAEAAFLTTSAALDICISTITRQVRQVPDRCPHCTSGSLSTQYGYNPDNPEETCQRPTCEKCGWTGVATRCYPPPPEPLGPPKVAGECSIQTVPLWNLQKPR